MHRPGTGGQPAQDVSMLGVQVRCLQAADEERRERYTMARESNAMGKSRAERRREKWAVGELVEARYSGGVTFEQRSIGRGDM